MIADVVEVIQTALAPVFLLAGTAGFLGVYVARLTRLADRVNTVERALPDHLASPDAALRWSYKLRQLHKRTLALELAALLATLSGFCTGMSILALLGGAMGRDLSESILFWFFSAAILCLLGSFVSFMYEIAIAGIGMLAQIRSGRRQNRSGN